MRISDKRCPPTARQRPGSQVSCCPDCHSRVWFRTAGPPTLQSWPGLEWLFISKFEETPQGNEFDDLNSLQTGYQATPVEEEWLSNQEQSFFLQGIKSFPKKWEKCISVRGDYIEKEIFFKGLAGFLICQLQNFLIAPRKSGRKDQK